MEPLNFTKTHAPRPYTFMGAMLAPRGAYYISYSKNDEYVCVFPVMYIQLWQDPTGMIWNVPLCSEEIQESVGVPWADNLQEYIEGVINEDRHIETCMTCDDLLRLCRRANQTDKEAIICMMDNLCEDIIKGDVGATPELRAYFKDGEWGNLLTMEDDGSLGQEWKERELKPDGTLKTR